MKRMPRASGRSDEVSSAIETCLALAAGHYENFPTASRLLPKRIREPVAIIYTFARLADDIADEGPLEPAERLGRLQEYRSALEHTIEGAPPDEPVFIALGDVLGQEKIDPQLLRDLLEAFRRDLEKTRYSTFSEVMTYCRFSANPVGRLILQLSGFDSPERLIQSDRICTALQLINFYQDIAQDFNENNRIYLPLDEMVACGVLESHIADQTSNAAMHGLMKIQFRRCRDMLQSGAPLAWSVPGRLGLELRMIVCSALRVLDRLEIQRDLYSRPRLGIRDMSAILWRLWLGPSRWTERATHKTLLTS